MREAELHVPFDALAAMGMDVAPERFGAASVRDVTVLACDGTESIVAITYSEPVDEALSSTAQVEWWDRLDATDDGVTYLCKTVVDEEECSSTGRGAEPAVRRVRPTEDGFAVTLIGSEDAFRCDGPVGRDVGAGVSLRRLTDYAGPTDALDALTSRQRDVLETAFDCGYYEVPREASADEIARRLGLDRSTVTEHLQRAERNVLHALFSD